MTKRRAHGDGTIDERGEGKFRLRYRVDGKRFAKSFSGSISDARKELRRLVHSGDVGEHVAPDKVTLAEWVTRWLALLERQQVEPDGKRRRGLVHGRTLEGYSDLMRCIELTTTMPPSSGSHSTSSASFSRATGVCLSIRW